MAAKPKQAPEPGPLVKIVDEIGDLEKELNPFKPKIARLEYLRKAMRGHYDDMPAEIEFQNEGTRYTLLVGRKAEERSVNAAALYKKIGPKAFLQVAKVTLTALASLSIEIATSVITSAATGARSLKIVEKAAAKA